MKWKHLLNKLILVLSWIKHGKLKKISSLNNLQERLSEGKIFWIKWIELIMIKRLINSLYVRLMIKISSIRLILSFSIDRKILYWQRLKKNK